MATNYYDLIIVGGGPGGSAAGIECARRGLRILLIETEAFPRSRPGETLPPGIDPLADTLGVNLCGFLRFAGYWTQWNCAEMRFISFGREGGSAWQGFHAWRAEFDSRLLQRAIDSGVEIRQPCRAMRPLTECRRVVGVLTDQGPVQAAFVVDASGCRQWLAQHLVLATARVTPRLLASYGYMRGWIPFDGPRMVADRDGWKWASEVKPGLYHWCRLNWSGKATDVGWRPTEFEGLRVVGKPRRADVTWRIVKSLAGPGFFLVGDAGWIVDPASSHGVLKAIMSGMMAGFLVARVLRDGRSAVKATRGYESWFEAWWRREVGRLRTMYSQLAYPPAWA